MGAMSGMHWLIVAGIIVFLFGPKKLPELAKGLGQSIREFKKSMEGLSDIDGSKDAKKNLSAQSVNGADSEQPRS